MASCGRKEACGGVFSSGLGDSDWQVCELHKPVDRSANRRDINPLFRPMNPYSAANADFYELTMSVGFWLDYHESTYPKPMKKLVHDAYFRKFPAENPERGDIYGYMIQSGVGPLVDFLINAHFTDEDIDNLKNHPAFTSGFEAKRKLDILTALKSWRFTGDVEAIPEGMPVAPFIPLVRITGNPIDTHIAETMVLNCLNTGLAYSTKARRISYSAGNIPVMDFSFRRMMAGVGGTTEIVRALMIGGFVGTSHTQAGRLLGVPQMGTHAHSWVMFFGSDQKAFEIYGLYYPESYCALLDTYDTLGKGVEADIKTTKRMILKKIGNQSESDIEKILTRDAATWRRIIETNRDTLGNIVYYARNDSGDQEYFTREVWRKFEEAGIESVKKIIATNDLDEYTLHQIVNGDSKVHVAGVGTKAVSDIPSPGVVYKLSAVIEDGNVRSVVKSGNPIKSTIPYPNVPLVLYDLKNQINGYVVCLPEEVEQLRKNWMTEIIAPDNPYHREKVSFASFFPLLQQYVKGGRLVVPENTFTDTKFLMRDAAHAFGTLPDSHKRLLFPQRLKYGLTPALYELRERLVKESHK